MSDEIKPMVMFTLTQDQYLDAMSFVGLHQCGLTEQGAAGGRISYTFTDTNLGQIQMVICACGASKDLTDYSDW